MGLPRVVTLFVLRRTFKQDTLIVSECVHAYFVFVFARIHVLALIHVLNATVYGPNCIAEKPHLTSTTSVVHQESMRTSTLALSLIEHD